MIAAHHARKQTDLVALLATATGALAATVGAVARDVAGLATAVAGLGGRVVARALGALTAWWKVDQYKLVASFALRWATSAVLDLLR